MNLPLRAFITAALLLPLSAAAAPKNLAIDSPLAQLALTAIREGYDVNLSSVAIGVEHFDGYVMNPYEVVTVITRDAKCEYRTATSSADGLRYSKAYPASVKCESR